MELNNTFYRLPSESAVKNWHDSTPDSFVFSVKASRFITHLKKLRNVEKELTTMLASVELLDGKLGPLLYQLPPSFERDDEAIKAFLSILPADRKHVFEFRHDSWLRDEVFEILRKHGVGFCVFDQPGVPCPVLATSNFGYLRFHGKGYSTSYSKQELSDWATKVRRLAQGLDAVFIYFNNDVRGYALNNARTLREFLGK